MQRAGEGRACCSQTSQPFKLKFSAHLVLDVLIKKICPVSPDRKALLPLDFICLSSATVDIVLSARKGCRKLSQTQLDLRPGLLLIGFELVAYIHKMMSHTLATWSNEQFVNVGK